MSRERRSSIVEYRSEGRIISGYAAKWNTISHDLGGFVETLSPYCFDLDNSRSVILNYEHEDSDILDRTDGGTLELRQDDVGLFFQATLPKRSPKIDVEGLIEQIQRRVLRGCSFAFDVVGAAGESWGTTADGRRLRTINRNSAVLFDVCITPCPAYEDTEVAVRSLRTLTSRESLRSFLCRLAHYERLHALRAAARLLHR